MEEKICPLLSIAEGKTVNSDCEKCAWGRGDGEYSRCLMEDIAEGLDCIHGTLVSGIDVSVEERRHPVNFMTR